MIVFESPSSNCSRWRLDHTACSRGRRPTYFSLPTDHLRRQPTPLRSVHLALRASPALGHARATKRVHAGHPFGGCGGRHDGSRGASYVIDQIYDVIREPLPLPEASRKTLRAHSSCRTARGTIHTSAAASTNAQGTAQANQKRSRAKSVCDYHTSPGR